VTVGTLVTSIDAELAWGFHHVDLPEERLRRARRSWRRLVDLFDRFGAPATWAVVGHLFLENCEESHGGHPAGERPCERDAGALPAGRAWFGGDLVDAVAGADADHEIAGHGHTHVHFDHDRMSPSFARSELESTRGAARQAGHDPSSFVFPVNRVAHRRLLGECGFDCYRGPAPTRGSPTGRRARKAAGALVDRGHPPVVRPRVDDHGLVNVPASMCLFDEVGPVGPVAEAVHGDPIAARARRGIDAAIARDGVCHLWFHPHEATTDRDFERLRAILTHAAERREAGDLRVETMGAVADRVRAEGSG
jgi:peptidoglycan/xylan/chitin deacetylase (PgdA/CDA1 family)